MTSPRTSEPVSTEELFRSHAPFVARFLYRLGVGADDLDDAVQEVFLVAHRNGGYTPGPATPTSYLGSIALRAASSHRRRGATRRARQSDVAPEQVLSADRGPVEILETRESLRELQAALDELDPDLRATLVLVELEGETCKSIAASLNIPVGTVYWRLHRARKKFRQTVDALRAQEAQSRASAEGRMERMAARGLLATGSKSAADKLLEAGRAQPPLHYDAATALARHQALVQAGTALPSWAAGAAAAATAATGIGVLAPAVLSAVVAAGAVGAVVAWRATEKTSAQAPPAASLVLPSTIERPVPEAARAVEQVPSSQPLEPSLSPTGLSHAGREPAVASITPRAAKGAPTEKADLVPEAQPLAPPPPVSATQHSGEPHGSEDAKEIQEVAAAERLLSTSPAQALALARAGEASYPSGYLREERRYIGVIALFKLGRLDEARATATRFLSDYPDGPFSGRVRAALTKAGGGD
jgi:RNA polymerase sigma-70 factor (ECF subfamily)